MSFWIQIKDHKVRFLKTLVLLTGYFGLGLLSAIVGPTLLDLRHQVQSSLTEVSFALTARAGGHALGSLMSKLSSAQLAS